LFYCVCSVQRFERQGKRVILLFFVFVQRFERQGKRVIFVVFVFVQRLKKKKKILNNDCRLLERAETDVIPPSRVHGGGGSWAVGRWGELFAISQINVFRLHFPSGPFPPSFVPMTLTPKLWICAAHDTRTKLLHIEQLGH